MIEDGVLKDPEVKAIMGQHVMPLQRSGTFGFCSGPMMASADELYITMRGKSGHAAIPQKAIDPIVASSEMVIALQKIVSRKLDPFSQGVLSITSINGGDSTNIIPDEVVMKGTLRSTDEEWRNDAHGMIEEIVHATARGNGCEADLEIRRGYPVLVTDHLVTEKAHRYANEIYGESDSFTALPLMVAEDFSYYLREVPGTFWWIGAGEVEQGCIAGLHNSTFTIDEEILWRGAAMMAWSACRFLEEEAQPGDG